MTKLGSIFTSLNRSVSSAFNNLMTAPLGGEQPVDVGQGGSYQSQASWPPPNGPGQPSYSSVMSLSRAQVGEEQHRRTNQLDLSRSPKRQEISQYPGEDSGRQYDGEFYNVRNQIATKSYSTNVHRLGTNRVADGGAMYAQTVPSDMRRGSYTESPKNVHDRSRILPGAQPQNRGSQGLNSNMRVQHVREFGGPGAHPTTHTSAATVCRSNDRARHAAYHPSLQGGDYNPKHAASPWERPPAYRRYRGSYFDYIYQLF